MSWAMPDSLLFFSKITLESHNVFLKLIKAEPDSVIYWETTRKVLSSLDDWNEALQTFRIPCSTMPFQRQPFPYQVDPPNVSKLCSAYSTHAMTYAQIPFINSVSFDQNLPRLVRVMRFSSNSLGVFLPHRLLQCPLSTRVSSFVNSPSECDDTPCLSLYFKLHHPLICQQSLTMWRSMFFVALQTPSISLIEFVRSFKYDQRSTTFSIVSTDPVFPLPLSRNSQNSKHSRTHEHSSPPDHLSSHSSSSHEKLQKLARFCFSPLAQLSAPSSQCSHAKESSPERKSVEQPPPPRSMPPESEVDVRAVTSIFGLRSEDEVVRLRGLLSGEWLLEINIPQIAHIRSESGGLVISLNGTFCPVKIHAVYSNLRCVLAPSRACLDSEMKIKWYDKVVCGGAPVVWCRCFLFSHKVFDYSRNISFFLTLVPRRTCTRVWCTLSHRHEHVWSPKSSEMISYGAVAL